MGALEADVLEDTIDLIRQLLEHAQGGEKSRLEADLKAINDERERRWLAFTS